MSCELIKEYDFCTIAGNTVFAKDFKIDEATEDWDLEFNISSQKIKVVWNVENGKLERVDNQTWKIKEYIETFTPAIYDFTMTYIVGDIRRTILKGRITVKSK